jgi:hypothetical protein
VVVGGLAVALGVGGDLLVGVEGERSPGSVPLKSSCVYRRSPFWSSGVTGGRLEWPEILVSPRPLA